MAYTVQEIVAANFLVYQNHPELTNQISTDGLVNAMRSILNSEVELPIDTAQEIIDAIPQLLMMRTLYDKTTSNFTKSVAAILENPAAVPDVTRVRILAYTYNTYRQLKSESEYRSELLGSEFVGEVGSKIEVTLRIANCRKFTPEYGVSYYRAVGFDMNGNAYSFMPKQMLDKSTEFSYKISAKIKKHEVNEYLYNAKVTVLWYIKEI